MPYLILVKHSLPEIEPDRPAYLWSLSAEGRCRCRPLADALAAYRPVVLVSSMESKARETGALVAAHLGIGCDAVEGLHEHERRTAKYLADADFQATMKEFFAQPDTLVFGEETARQAHDRFAHAVEQVVRRCPRESIVVVAHGTVIALFAARHAGIDPFSLWQRLSLPSFVAFGVPDYRLAAQWAVHGCRIHAEDS